MSPLLQKKIMLFAFTFLFVLQANSKNFELNFNAPFVANEIILKVKNSEKNSCAIDKIGEPTIANVLNQIGAMSVQKMFPRHQEPEGRLNKFGEKMVDISLIYKIKLTGNFALDKAINKLIATGKIEYAQPNYTQQLCFTPNDPSIALQYYLDKINAYNGWDIGQGDTNTVVGVTDTGTELLHPDLINSIKYNYLDPIDGIDNDLDGYTDNYYGWDLGENDNTPQCNANFHGLHSAGISSASVNNAMGIAGVGFKAKYLPIKISDAAGTLNTSYEGIVYAADHGCSIINCSWGGVGAGQFGQDIVNYATFNAGSLVIASAGNNGDDVLFYPASYDNVLNVAASDQVDHKKANSTYGISIDVCAPGEDILSTWINGTYVSSGGTSTAAPVVSGAAAIVRSFFPSYSPLQIGEQLKATCDVIDTIAFNLPYAGKLGRGRINLYRALTETNLPSIVLTAHNETDNNDNAFVVGDTLEIEGTFTNYLANTTGVIVKATTTSAFVSLMDSVYNLGTLNSMQSASNNATPFTAKILAGAPQNSTVEFKLTITDAAGHTFINYIVVIINVDYINININDVATTITSKGNIGFNGNGNQATQGLGFKYNGSNLLWEAGLMVGNSSTQVSDRVRGLSGLDVDFSVVSNVTRAVPSAISEFDVNGTFNDDGAGASKLPVKILQSSYCYTTPGNTKYVIFKYRIVNTGTTPLSSLYAGILADWDIANSNLNKGAFDANNNMGYCYSTQGGGPYAGIKLLSNTAPIINYAVDNVSGGAGGIDPVGGISTAEKYIALSQNRMNAGGAGNGNDVMHVVSSGPFNLLPNDTATVAFALIAGDSLQDIQSSASAAQIKYNGITVQDTQLNTLRTISIYPNPANDKITVLINNNYSIKSVRLMDITGHTVDATLVDHTISIANLASGLYVVEIVDTKGNLYRTKLLKR